MKGEPAIIINGVPLNIGQAMAVRVAVSSMKGEMLGPNPLGNDAHGITMAALYAKALGEVETLMWKAP